MRLCASANRVRARRPKEGPGETLESVLKRPNVVPFEIPPIDPADGLEVGAIHDPAGDFDNYIYFHLLAGREIRSDEPLRSPEFFEEFRQILFDVLDRKGGIERDEDPDVIMTFWAGEAEANLVEEFTALHNLSDPREFTTDSLPDLESGKKGALVIDMIDAKTNRTVWRAYCSLNSRDRTRDEFRNRALSGGRRSHQALSPSLICAHSAPFHLEENAVSAKHTTPASAPAAYVAKAIRQKGLAVGACFQVRLTLMSCVSPQDGWALLRPIGIAPYRRYWSLLLEEQFHVRGEPGELDPFDRETPK